MARVDVARHLSRVIEALADHARATLPRDVGVSVLDDGLVLTGKRLRARSLTDPRLRNVRR